MKDVHYIVQVSCVTYNHAPYIEDAMNGFCMQETRFPFVCTIVDDCSTDGEQKVIKNYLQEHFDLEDASVVRNEETDDYYLTFAQHKTNKNCFFAILFLKYNHYSVKKPKTPYLIEWSNTKYMAICEGDDYWIDPRKLQIQVDYLEKHKECGLVYSKAKTYIQKRHRFGKTAGRFSKGFDDLLLDNKVVTTTTLFKTSLYFSFLDFQQGKSWKMGDKPLWLYISYNTGIYFFDQEFAVYRILENSATSRNSYERRVDFINSSVDVQLCFAALYKKEYIPIITDNQYRYLFHNAIEFKKFKIATNYYRKITNRNAKLKMEFIFCKILSFFHE